MTVNTAQPAKKSGFPIFSITVLGFGFYAYNLSTDPVDEVLKKGQDAVLLHYINHANWGTIRCNEGRHDGHDTLYCHPVGNTRRGGLYVIGRENGEPVIYPINGTGMAQMQQASIEAVDTSRVAVREWDEARIDIRTAIDGTL